MHSFETIVVAPQSPRTICSLRNFYPLPPSSTPLLRILPISQLYMCGFGRDFGLVVHRTIKLPLAVTLTHQAYHYGVLEVCFRFVSGNKNDLDLLTLLLQGLVKPWLALVCLCIRSRVHPWHCFRAGVNARHGGHQCAPWERHDFANCVSMAR